MAAQFGSTGATWEWYDGDPNGGGNFLFSTGTAPFIIGQAITASTNYFVRAEGSVWELKYGKRECCCKHS